MKRSIVTLLAAAIMTAGISMTAWAGEWKEFDGGWWYQEADGSYFADGWHWIDGKCYYFTADGTCLINTATPDGYQVDETGAWIVDGVVQTQAPFDCSRWLGVYKADDGQIITVTAADENRVNISFQGYSEEGWYTMEYLLNYSNSTKTEAVYEEATYGGNTMKTVYTLSDAGIEVTVLPYGGWAQGMYIRQ